MTKSDNNLSPVSSPCILVCQIDKKTGLCYGCYRNLEEIGNWLHYSEQERLKIMAELPSRKSKLDLP